MADNKKNGNSSNEALYQWISYDLQNIKGELMNELKLSSAQIASLYGSMKNDKDQSASAIAQEIRYSYKQNQNIYDGLSASIKNDVAERLNAMDEKMAALEKLEAILSEITDLKYNYMQLQSIYEGISSILSGDVVPKLDAIVDKDAMQELVEESVSVHSQQVLDAIAAVPVPENVDYARITEEVGDKMLEILNDLKAEEVAPEQIDYERVAGDTAAKVVESLPHNEGFDYARIEEAIANAVNVDAIATAVAGALNVDAIAEAVAAKIVLPEAPEAPEVDYDQLADLVVEKLAAKGMSADIMLDEEGIEKIADTVAEKVGVVEPVDYDKISLLAQAAQIAPEAVDYDKVAGIVEEKIALGNVEIEKVITLDDEGIAKIVDGVAEELRNMTLVCEYEDVVEELAEEPVEEAVEEPVEEAVAEEVVEEIVEEAPVEEELAAAIDPVYEEDLQGQLIDAETGLVVRLKRSFTAKMKQSEERIKAYYSDIKNALTSYKRINSNVSWHGDRYNFGRETVAKIGINGKTLCFYLALDPNNPELKTTVYHQRDVGAQKAYENTPFMVKVKSDAAAKKALRLVGILAQKLGAVEDESFQEVDYVAEYAYESTKRLFEEGDIKATKEKKVDFNF